MPKINPFIADVKALKLRFPIATIAKRTDEEKRNVSAYVHGRKAPPEAFLKKFYAEFKQDLAAVGIHRRIYDPPNDCIPPAVREHWARVERLLERQVNATTQILESTKRIEERVDQIVKWSKFANQLWEKN